MLSSTQLHERLQALSSRFENKSSARRKSRSHSNDNALLGYAQMVSAYQCTMSLRHARRKAFMIMTGNLGEDGFVYVTQKATGARLCNTPSQFMYNHIAGELYSCEQSKARTADDGALKAITETLREIYQDITDIAAEYDPKAA